MSIKHNFTSDVQKATVILLKPKSLIRQLETVRHFGNLDSLPNPEPKHPRLRLHDSLPREISYVV